MARSARDHERLATHSHVEDRLTSLHGQITARHQPYSSRSSVLSIVSSAAVRLGHPSLRHHDFYARCRRRKVFVQMLPVCDLSVVARRILTTAGEQGHRPVVAVDGPGGAGKSTFAAHLQEHLSESTVVHVDDFYRLSSQRPQQRVGIADNFDLERLAEQVLRPASRGLATRYQRYDWDTDSLAEWIDVPATGSVLIEGVYSLQMALREHYSYRVFCTTNREERLRRGITRDGEAARSTWVDEWMPAEDRYIAQEEPSEAAELVVDGSTAVEAAGVRFLILRD